ncbi:MAG TPA: hypothetical protein VMV46_18450 [Thermoanaerobaculia bacterium]|nr:hypothetical protein [Thermoanaerobaculia bacterium]
MNRATVVVRALVSCGLLLLLVAGCASIRGAAPTALAVPPPPPLPAVGSWNLVIETPIGNQESILVLEGPVDDLVGKISGTQGETSLRDIVVTGDTLTFAITIDAQGQQMDLTFEGAVTGDSLTGTFTSPFGPAPVTGTRGTS